MSNTISSSNLTHLQHSGFSSSEKNENSLSDKQQTIISETLAMFDVDNISEADAISIVDAFSQAGIQAGKSLESAMAIGGFDAKVIGELANIKNEHQRPPPPKQSTEEISSMVDYLKELLDEKLAEKTSDSLSEEDKQSILAQVFEKFDIEHSESIINTTA